MIGRVQDRATFEAFRRQGRRARRGPVTLVFVPAEATPARSDRVLPGGSADHQRVAFGIGRNVGNAVVRNRLRRQLRHIMRDMSQATPPLPAGAYLVIVRPNVLRLSYLELQQTMQAACEEVGS